MGHSDPVLPGHQGLGAMSRSYGDAGGGASPITASPAGPLFGRHQVLRQLGAQSRFRALERGIGVGPGWGVARGFSHGRPPGQGGRLVLE